ncbi:antitoxin VbhA family protein [Arthrobacter sp. KNU40]|uniref:antitoxin VbhA family protein n=1 Tax=Arthrobacter sp. KNU40 TaxID=3447965 RepID=UPI003F63D523
MAPEPAGRVLTPEQKRELTIDVMASWALDGLYPSRETVESINEFLASGLTAGQYIEKLKEKWRQTEGD